MVTDAIHFSDLRFPIHLSLGAVGGEEMQTNLQITGSGYEYRNADWDEMRGRWDVARHVQTLEQARTLISFFRARQAQTFSFRWQSFDRLDRTVTHSVFATADGIKATFNLVKLYPDAVAPQSRRIILPLDANRFEIETPFAVYANAVLVTATDYVIDFRNGRVTFDTPPSNGVVLSWSGEYDIPVRFGDPQLRRTYITHNQISFDQVSIMEVLPQEILETPDL